MIPGLHNLTPEIISGATYVAVGGPLPERPVPKDTPYPNPAERTTYSLTCCTEPVPEWPIAKKAQHVPFWRRFEKRRRGKKRL